MCQTPEDRLNQLMARASSIEFIHGLDIQQYFRCMRSMINMVKTYLNEGQKENAYVLAAKFTILYLDYLRKHREYPTLDARLKQEWNDRCRSMLEKAETFKEELRERYKLEYEQFLQNEAEKKRKDEEELQRANELKAREISIVARSYISSLNARNNALSISAASEVQKPPEPPVSLPSYPSIDSLTLNSKQAIRDAIAADSISNASVRFDSSNKQSETSNAYGWSTVRLSFKLVDEFLNIAAPNTSANKETCASLCGRLVGTGFHITDVIVPKQSGSADSCTTYNEEELFDYTDKNCLLTLGWIHTHPTQTAFLSSIDQHCQLSYQLMLPEAIAIVCAPKYNDFKVFSLTPNNGIPLVRNCKQLGFHPHPSKDPIFEPSKHVVDDPTITFKVVDLR